MERGEVLLVGEESGDLSGFARALEGWPITTASSLEEATSRLPEIEDLWLALLSSHVEGQCRNHDVFWLAGVLRDRWPRAEVLIFKDEPDPVVNRAHEVGARVLSTFMCHLNRRVIEERLVERAQVPHGPHTEVLEQVRADYGLTPGELRIVALRFRGLSQADMAQELGISKSPVKTHVRNILAKTGAEELRDLVRWTDGGRRLAREQ